MKNYFRKRTVKKGLAILLAMVLSFTGAASVSAVDYIHSEANHHYLVYTDMEALFEKMAQAYYDNQVAELGGNVFLPLTKGVEVTHGMEYLNEIQDNLMGKYLVDTITITDQLIVYLTANIKTYEFYLLVYNTTEDDHEFTIAFANGMIFEEVATTYSFNLAELSEETSIEEDAGDGDLEATDDLIPEDEAPDGASNESSDEITDEIPDGTTDDTPSEGTDETLDKAIDETSDKGTDETSDKATDETSDRATDEASDTGNDETTDETTNETSDRATDEASDTGTDGTSDKATDETPDEAVEEADEEVVYQNSEGTIDKAPNGVKDQSTDGTIDKTPDGSTDENSDRATDEASDKATETPDRATDVSSDNVTKEAPDSANDEISDEATYDGSSEAISGSAIDFIELLPMLEIASFISKLTLAPNSISLLSTPNTVTTTEFNYDLDPNTLTIAKELKAGDEAPSDTEFEFYVTINGEPYNNTIISSTSKIRTIENGRLYLNAGEIVTINVDINEDGSVVPYEVTELQYTEEGVISELVDVKIITGNGIRDGNTVRGMLGIAGIPGYTYFTYYSYSTATETVKEGGKYITYYTYEWYSSNDMVNWTKLGGRERTKNTTPTLIFDSETYEIMTGYFDYVGNYVETPIDLYLDYMEGSSNNSGTTIKVKDYYGPMIFYFNADYNNLGNHYESLNRYSYMNSEYMSMSSLLNLVAPEYSDVGYVQLGSRSQRNRQRLVYFFNSVTSRTMYKVTNITPGVQPVPSNVSIVFTNSYKPIVGTIKVNKSINDYYSAHGNPVFFYRLDKMKGNHIEATYYDYIEFDLSGTNAYTEDGIALDSRSSQNATSVLFDRLPAGTYVLTEEQPIRYKLASVGVNTGIADISQASEDNNGKVIIVIELENTEIEVSYFNEKHTNLHFSHTDLVKNSITIVPKLQ